MILVARRIKLAQQRSLIPDAPGLTTAHYGADALTGILDEFGRIGSDRLPAPPAVLRAQRALALRTSKKRRTGHQLKVKQAQFLRGLLNLGRGALGLLGRGGRQVARLGTGAWSKIRQMGAGARSLINRGRAAWANAGQEAQVFMKGRQAGQAFQAGEQAMAEGFARGRAFRQAEQAAEQAAGRTGRGAVESMEDVNARLARAAREGRIARGEIPAPRTRPTTVAGGTRGAARRTAAEVEEGVERATSRAAGIGKTLKNVGLWRKGLRDMPLSMKVVTGLQALSGDPLGAVGSLAGLPYYAKGKTGLGTALSLGGGLLGSTLAVIGPGIFRTSPAPAQAAQAAADQVPQAPTYIQQASASPTPYDMDMQYLQQDPRGISPGSYGMFGGGMFGG